RATTISLAASPYDCQASVAPTPMKTTMKNRVISACQSMADGSPPDYLWAWKNEDDESSSPWGAYECADLIGRPDRAHARPTKFRLPQAADSASIAPVTPPSVLSR